MTKKTTLRKLQRLKDMREAEVNGTTWWVNPKGHPEPRLPSQEYLEGEYLKRVSISNPRLLDRACELVSSTDKERRICT